MGEYQAAFAAIALTQSKWAIVSLEDWPEVSRFKWCVTNNPDGRKKSRAPKFYAVRRTKFNRYYLHRVIGKPESGLLIDHINGDSLDNRRENLRAVTHKENARNRANWRESPSL